MKPNRKKKRKSAPPLTQEAAIAWVEEHGWSFSSLTSIWRRSRQDEEAIEIMADLTGLNRQGVRALLGLEDTVPEAQSQGIAAFWADY
ncbi:MAG: hypothetical protein J6C66_02720 [Prevotella sp.]|nr:hypothetical protein [Prevotella sp.]